MRFVPTSAFAIGFKLKEFVDESKDAKLS